MNTSRDREPSLAAGSAKTRLGNKQVRAIVTFGTVGALSLGILAVLNGRPWDQAIAATGSVASVFGLIVVIIQLAQIQKVSEASVEASRRAINRLSSSVGLADVSRTSARLVELRQLIDDGKFELAWYRIEGIIESLMRLVGAPVINEYLPREEFEILIKSMQGHASALQRSKQKGTLQASAELDPDLRRLSFLLLKAETAVTFQGPD